MKNKIWVDFLMFIFSEILEQIQQTALRKATFHKEPS